jgi:hypothetical protein
MHAELLFIVQQFLFQPFIPTGGWRKRRAAFTERRNCARGQESADALTSAGRLGRTLPQPEVFQALATHDGGAAANPEEYAF